MKKNLKSGYTTGACAAAAAKAAAMFLLQNTENREQSTDKENLSSGFWVLDSDVEIPFPDGGRHKFKIHNSELMTQDSQFVARASVIKDAGDDPDVTNGAEIVAEVRIIREDKKIRGCEDEKKTNDAKFSTSMYIKGGKGVGIVTKPGLAVVVGESAINPVPRKMIKEAVLEAIEERLKLRGGDGPIFNGAVPESGLPPTSAIEITISVVNGEKLAKKTLNSRLGIIGGISILGTTGIVRPVSAEAWTATITSSMDVARAMEHLEIVLSAGRTSEKAHMKKFNFPEECYVMMGDYLEFSLLEAKKHRFKKIHLCAQWAKMLKIAMATPQTHVRHGAIDLKLAVEFLGKRGQGVKVSRGQELLDNEFNTAREIFDFINTSHIRHHASLFSLVCSAAKKYAEEITGGISVISHLVSYDGEVIISRD